MLLAPLHRLLTIPVFLPFFPPVDLALPKGCLANGNVGRPPIGHCRACQSTVERNARSGRKNGLFSGYHYHCTMMCSGSIPWFTSPVSIHQHPVRMVRFLPGNLARTYACAWSDVSWSSVVVGGDVMTWKLAWNGYMVTASTTSTTSIVHDDPILIYFEVVLFTWILVGPKKSLPNSHATIFLKSGPDCFDSRVFHSHGCMDDKSLETAGNGS